MDAPANRGLKMKRVLRWIGIVLGGLAALALVAAGTVFLLSEQSMAGSYEPRAEALPRPSPSLLADAPRQARIRGCVSCHGEGLKGKLMVEVPNVVRVHAPNLTEIAARASDQQLAAAIRDGIGHDGRNLFVMPSQTYARLSEEEVAALIAYIRSLPRVRGSTDGVRPGPIGRFAIVTGKLRPVPAKMEEFRTQAPIDLGPAHMAGRRIAATTCSDCHGPALLGMTMEDGKTAPDLTLAGAYDAADFRKLMRTGKAMGGRDLGLMSEVARNDFSHFTDAELDALHSYLKARAERLTR
jgi:mono/diheme cytochrome c family protein